MNSNYFQYDGVTFSRDMKSQGFIKLLEKKGYKYMLVEDKIIITHYTNVYLEKVRTLPENVIFDNESDAYLNDLESISPGVQFINNGSVNLKLIKIEDLRPGVFMNTRSLWTEWFNNIHWQCDVPGIRKGVLLDLMIKKGLFER